MVLCFAYGCNHNNDEAITLRYATYRQIIRELDNQATATQAQAVCRVRRRHRGQLRDQKRSSTYIYPLYIPVQYISTYQNISVLALAD